MDAVTETKITTQNFDAELGKAVSAVMTAQTRSGTNNFHGAAYDFRTGNANLARDPFTQPPNSYTKPLGQLPSIPAGLKNRFGGSIGGPVLKNKFFFFANYEAQRQKVGTAATGTLPTNNLTESCLGKITGSGAGGIAGCDFSEYEKQLGAAGIIYYPTTSEGVTTYTAYPNNVIPTAQISPQFLNIITLLAPYAANVTYIPGAANVGNLDSNYHGSGTGLFNSNQWTERLDYTLTEKAHAFERFSRFWDTLSGTTLYGANMGGPGFGIGGYGGTSTSADDSLAAGMDIAINPKLLTDFRLGYYRYNIIDAKLNGSVNFDTSPLDIPGINLPTYPGSGGTSGFFVQTLPGGAGGYAQPMYGQSLQINRCNCPLTEREDQGQIVNNWTQIVRNHTFKEGVDLRYGRNLRVPSDTDRNGDLNFGAGPTSDPLLPTPGGLGFATFALGEVSYIANTMAETNTFGRYVGNTVEGNAKERQKRTFFYAQDSWRATPKLTLNLGVRWELYFPETVNGPGAGALLNLADGYLHVAQVGSIPSDMGWKIAKWRQLEPRLGVSYQMNPKTVIRAGYGRSFDIGVFGSVFGHTVTQNLPVLANQEVSAATPYLAAFTLAQGPPPNVFPTVPSNGLLPNPGAAVTTKSRPNPMTFPTVDAWNLSVQRAITPTLALTVAYVGNKGTHTLGDGDSRNTNPNEAAINLPGSFSVTGQTLRYDPTVPAGTISATNGTSTTNFLQRYYALSLPACRDPNYTTPSEPYVTAGMCGWTQAIFYQGDNQNTEFNALQATLSQAFAKGLAYTVNYQWAAAFDENSTYWTWDAAATHMRDSNVRDQQVTLYGSYDFPFGKGKQFVPNANRALDLLIGGYQLSGVMSWAGGLPFSVSYNEASSNVPGSAPNYPSEIGRMKTSLTGFKPGSSGTGTRSFYQQQTADLLSPAANAAGTGVFLNPGLDNIGNTGYNNYRGPGLFDADLAMARPPRRGRSA